MIGEHVLLQAVDVLVGDAIGGWLARRRSRQALARGVAAAIEDVVTSVLQADTSTTVIVEGTEVVSEADRVAGELAAAFHANRRGRRPVELISLQESWRAIATEAWTPFATTHHAEIEPMVERFVRTLSLHIAVDGGELGHGLERQATILEAAITPTSRAGNAAAVMHAEVEVVDAVRLANGFAMDDLLITWTNSSDQPLEHIGFRFDMRTGGDETGMATFDSGEHDLWVTLRAGEARVWSLLQLLLANPTPFRADLALKTLGGTVYIGDSGGFIIEMDAYQPGAGRRLAARFGWSTDDPFHWPIVGLRFTERDSPH